MRHAIYGAGKGGRMVLAAMREQGEDIDFFVDEFIADRTVLGKPVYRVAEIADRGDIDLYFTLSVDAEIPDQPGRRVIAHLETIGFDRVIQWDKFVGRYPTLLNSWYDEHWKNCDYAEFLNKYHSALHHYENHRLDMAKIDELKSYLSDDQSIEILDRLIHVREDVRRGPILDLPDQVFHYLPLSIDVYRGIEELKFADCGAFDGDTVAHIMNCSRVPVSYVASFEPDPRCFGKLQKTTEQLKKGYPGTDFLTYSCGVSAANGFANLANAGEACATLTTDRQRGAAIPVVALDSVLGANPPNFVKYDVEGAEELALAGTQDIIRDCHPTLAVSIYHQADHLWKLPLQVKNYYPDYEMYIRHHHWSVWETVLYCVAPSGAKITR